MGRRIYFILLHNLSLMFQMDFTVRLHGKAEDQNRQKWGINRSPCKQSGSPYSHPRLEIFLCFGFSDCSISLYSGLLLAFTHSCCRSGHAAPSLLAVDVERDLPGEMRVLWCVATCSWSWLLGDSTDPCFPGLIHLPERTQWRHGPD